jgi:hypothetical protein
MNLYKVVPYSVPGLSSDGARAVPFGKPEVIWIAAESLERIARDYPDALKITFIGEVSVLCEDAP